MMETKTLTGLGVLHKIRGDSEFGGPGVLTSQTTEISRVKDGQRPRDRGLGDVLRVSSVPRRGDST